MKKKDLKTGMVLLIGEEPFLLVGNIFQGKEDWTSLDGFNDDLTRNEVNNARVQGDINAITSIINDGGVRQEWWDSELTRSLIWKREEKSK